jgi:phosphatidylglycerophosphatase C
MPQNMRGIACGGSALRASCDRVLRLGPDSPTAFPPARFLPTAATSIPSHDLALFDFDGTITMREMMPDFIRLAIEPRGLAWGKVLPAPLVVGYRLGVVSGTIVRSAIVRFGFTGMSVAALEAHGAGFARTHLPPVVLPEALERIHWHRQQGDTVVVVSGAFDVYLRHWCQSQQVDLICSSLEHRDGRLTGRYLGRQCVLEEKARRVRELMTFPATVASTPMATRRKTWGCWHWRMSIRTDGGRSLPRIWSRDCRAPVPRPPTRRSKPCADLLL